MNITQSVIYKLYRRNNFNQPCVWQISCQGNNITIHHGILNKKLIEEHIISDYASGAEKEVESRIKAKRKSGYKWLDELKDNNSIPVGETGLYHYLEAYLPYDRTTADNTLLPMLAKVYEEDKKYLLDKRTYVGQPKINGLRCFITAYKNNDLFKPYSLKFQSREGTYWNTLQNLEEYLLTIIPKDFLDRMVEEHIALDGELYLPGHSVNEINHFVKSDCPENKLLQYWCYDVAWENATQYNRLYLLGLNFSNYILGLNIENHYDCEDRFRYLNFITIDANKVETYRDNFIELGYEGLILRDIDGEYQFGKRNHTMLKYKRATDGKFLIKDIIPEGIKRPDIPLFICKNDINDAEFEVHISSSLDKQRYIFKNKEHYLGKYLYIEYGERSGVNQVPFHVKKVKFV